MCREPCNLLFKCILTIAHNGVEIERTEIYRLNFLAKFRFDTAEYSVSEVQLLIYLGDFDELAITEVSANKKRKTIRL